MVLSLAPTFETQYEKLFKSSMGYSDEWTSNFKIQSQIDFKISDKVKKKLKALACFVLMLTCQSLAIGYTYMYCVKLLYIKVVKKVLLILLFISRESASHYESVLFLFTCNCQYRKFVNTYTLHQNTEDFTSMKNCRRRCIYIYQYKNMKYFNYIDI